MDISRRGACAVVVGAAIAGAGRPAFAAGSVVHVSLWDKGPDSMAPLGAGPGMGMAMPGADMSMATMGVTPDIDSAPAGEITFEAVNDSKEMVHEMVVAPVADPDTPLPYDAANEKVDEDAAGHLGEVAELEPGQSGALRITMRPGRYILYCNIPGHYALGMWTLFTVT